MVLYLFGVKRGLNEIDLTRIAHLYNYIKQGLQNQNKTTLALVMSIYLYGHYCALFIKTRTACKYYCWLDIKRVTQRNLTSVDEKPERIDWLVGCVASIYYFGIHWRMCDTFYIAVKVFDSTVVMYIVFIETRQLNIF